MKFFQSILDYRFLLLVLPALLAGCMQQIDEERVMLEDRSMNRSELNQWVTNLFDIPDPRVQLLGWEQNAAPIYCSLIGLSNAEDAIFQEIFDRYVGLSGVQIKRCSPNNDSKVSIVFAYLASPEEILNIPGLTKNLNKASMERIMKRKGVYKTGYGAEFIARFQLFSFLPKVISEDDLSQQFKKDVLALLLPEVKINELMQKDEKLIVLFIKSFYAQSYQQQVSKEEYMSKMATFIFDALSKQDREGE